MKVPRDLVHAVMYQVDPDALEQRAPKFKKEKSEGHFISADPNFVHSLDGHEKFMDYQNSCFPIAV